MKRTLQAVPSHPQQADRHTDTPDLLSQTEICANSGISVQTWWRWRQAGLVPEAVVLPSGRLKWRREDIDRLFRKRPTAAPLRRYFTSVRGGR